MTWHTIGFTADDIQGAWQHDRLARECAAAFAAEGVAPFGVFETIGEGEHLVYWFISDEAAQLFERHDIHWYRFLVRSGDDVPPQAHRVMSA